MDADCPLGARIPTSGTGTQQMRLHRVFISAALAMVAVACAPTRPTAAGSSKPPAPTQRTPSTQALEEVVYLKDGSIIRGVIVEQRPSESILIRTKDGNQFRYKMELVDRITKEPAVGGAPAAQVGPVVPVKKKDPATAALLSFLVPGLGSIYAGEVFSGLVWFGLSVYGYSSYVEESLKDYCIVDGDCTNANLGLAIGVFSYVFSIFDASWGAKRTNEEAAKAAELALRTGLETLAEQARADASAKRGPARTDGVAPHPVGLVRVRR